MSSYLVGVDIGGTFTDCVIIDETGYVTTAKVPSTPPNFQKAWSVRFVQVLIRWV
jgi:N-methylhydantoinase A